MLRRLVAVVAAALVVAPAAAASPVAEVLGPSGAPVASAGPGPFAYPADGSVLAIGSSTVSAGGVELDDVSLLGSRIQVGSIVLPLRGGRARIDDLVVGGHVVRAGVNGLVPLGGADYLVASQAATTGAATGVVGLRISLGDDAYGIPAGTQILVGLQPAPVQPGHSLAAESVAAPLAVLGFGNAGAAVALPAGAPSPFLAGGSTGEQAVAIAERYLGVPYVWGGASPLGGFDCSGLTMFVYAQLGIHLDHYTGDQIHEGVPVPRDELEPGDLVFFEPSPAGPQHEGIYVGGDQFVQAPHTGDIVRISSLDEPAYALSYVGAVRPFSS